MLRQKEVAPITFKWSLERMWSKKATFITVIALILSFTALLPALTQ